MQNVDDTVHQEQLCCFFVQYAQQRAAVPEPADNCQVSDFIFGSLWWWEKCIKIAVELRKKENSDTV